MAGPSKHQGMILIDTGQLLAAARMWYEAGCCVIPTHSDRSKRPHTQWAQYQSTRPELPLVERWLSEGQLDGLGVITGQVSGHLELIEFESRAVAAGAVGQLIEQAEQQRLTELLRILISGCSVRSASGGLHLFFRCADSAALPNTKLAIDDQHLVLAETRGEGGFVVVAPTTARTGQPPGSAYEFLHGSPTTIPTLTQHDRAAIHGMITATLDRRPAPQINFTAPSTSLGTSPGDAFAARNSWEQILIPAGWQAVGAGSRDGHPLVYWRRPGKSDGVSATSGGPGDHLYVFSSSTPLPSEQPLTKFAVFTYLHHGGVFSDAAKALVASGYGSNTPRSPTGGLRGLETFNPAEDTEVWSQALGDTFSDLSWVSTGERRPPEQPKYLQIDLERALFYTGRINGLFGDPETAKSWIAQATITEALQNGDRAAYLDIDHNGAPEIAERLLLLGADPHTISNPNQFRIYEPQDQNGIRQFLHDMANWEPHLVIIDSLGELIPMMGAKSIDNDELTTAMRAILKPLAHEIGACVITIDHLPKGQDARSSGYAIGGIAKKRAIDGIYLSCEAIDPAAPGQTGKIRLSIEKDRHGQVRAHATGKIAGDFILDSTDPAKTITTIQQPATAQDGKIKPTATMRAVANYLISSPGWTATSRNSIHTALTASTNYKRHTIDRAIDQLATEGYITIEPTIPGRPSTVKLTKPYSPHGLIDATEILR